MKQLSIILLIASFVFILQSCQSEKFDFRYRFTGEFDVKGSWGASDIESINDTLPIVTIATVILEPDGESLAIDFEGFFRITPTIKRNGEMVIEDAISDFVGGFHGNDLFSVTLLAPGRSGFFILNGNRR
jgi:hypothetical protein